jgi:hypothetical protein
MKKKEIREMVVTYCDYCGAELKYGHTSILLTDGQALDFCNEYTEEITENCVDKYRKTQRVSNSAQSTESNN